MKSLALVALAMLVAVPLRAQMVVTNDTLDAERRELRDAITVLRDSLQTVQAAAAQFERGHAGASDELLHSRARSILRGCARSTRNIEHTRQIIGKAKWDSDFLTGRQNDLLAQLDQVEKSMNACQTVWLEMSSDIAELRERGPTQAAAVAADVLAYDSAVGDYFKALGIYLRPAGS